MSLPGLHRVSFVLSALLLCLPLAHGQEGAPLVSGLGGPLDVGQPHDLRENDPVLLAPAFPEGIRYHEPGLFDEVYVNWSGSLSFGVQDSNGAGRLPRAPFDDGFVAPRIVPFGHSSELLEWREGDMEGTPIFYANLPPGADGEPGRFIATWYRLTKHFPIPGRPDLYVTFQAILTAGADPGTFDVELRYNQCQWYFGLGRAHQPAVKGFGSGRGPDGPGWEWGGSRSEDMQLLCRLSNVGEPGIFRYRVVDGIPTGCGIDRDPPPGEGRCADGNHLPGDGCSPDCYIEPDADGDGVTEAPYPGALDPRGVYDDCADPADMACNDDNDGDGIPPHLDNCVDVANPDQANYDGDRFGDACEIDPDDDDLPDEAFENFPADLCPRIYSAGSRMVDPELGAWLQQPDIDRDGLSDACDPDDDGDGVLDCGGDGLCDPDADGYNNDKDHLIDEGGECAEGTGCHHGAGDFFDNDGDGLVDEASEAEYPFAIWPGPDLPPSAPEDNCRRIPNADQIDTDRDGIGDACDPDMDGDGIPNCAGNGICGPTADGRDNDGDGIIDERDECAAGCGPEPDLIDQDMDGFVDEDRERLQAEEDGAILPPPLDNCPRVASDDQRDWDADGIGDVCDDSDRDGFMDAVDNCREVPGSQDDLDLDGIGDVCDDDRDGDLIPNERDGCPDAFDSGVDTDGDGQDDICDPDDDDDGVNDPFDVCPLDYDVDQADSDADGQGDACDPDLDGDGVDNGADRCPATADDQTDTDADGQGDACDADDDGDGIDDSDDVCPLDRDLDQADRDGDGVGDACDPTDDRPFVERTPEEKCAILIADRAATAERLRHCPPPTDGGCAAAPGLPSNGGWLFALLGLLGLVRRRA